MANIIRRPGWRIPEKEVTPEFFLNNRREFCRKLSVIGGGLVAGSWTACGRDPAPPSAAPAPAASATKTKERYPAPRNPEFNPKIALTSESDAGNYNNFYEFSLGKQVTRYTGQFTTSPWKVEIKGKVEKPGVFDLEELLNEFSLEERIYRLRCVEAWAMIVPWTGFPLSKLLQKVAPTSDAKFVRFESFNRPDQCPGMRQVPDYPWPYFEGLRIEEAMNPLTMVVTGIYGKPLPKQHGAPIRVVVPWKYGYKSIKSIVKIELITSQPKTFWEALQPQEYPFESNVDPRVPHPRWSQATERMLGSGDRAKTQLYNGYGAYVANLYAAK